MIKWVIFDLGGVLVDIRRDWKSCVEANGFPYPEEGIEQTLEITKLYERYQRGELSLEQLSEQLVPAMNGVFTPGQIQAIHRAILIGQFPGVTEVVERVNQGQAKSAILSNTCGAHWPILQSYSAVAQVNQSFTSFQLGLVKPDPQIYRAVEEALKIAPSSILFFDDSPLNVAAARDQGWSAELVSQEFPPATQLREYLKVYQVIRD